MQQSAFYLYLLPLVFGLVALWQLYRNSRTNASDVDDSHTVHLSAAVASFIGVALLGYWFTIGGDVYGERHILLMVPLGIILTAWALQRWLGSRSVWIAPTMLLLIGAQLSTVLLDPRFEYRTEKYDRYIELGQALAVTHPGATIAVDAAGKVPYVSGLRAIDMLGLNDHHIARTPEREFLVGHSRYDPGYILEREPDLIMAWSTNEELDLAWGLSRDVYSSAGYTPLYMLNGTAGAASYNMLRVEGETDESLAILRRMGYWIVVLGSSELVGHSR